MNITIYQWNRGTVEKKQKILRRAELDMSDIAEYEGFSSHAEALKRRG